MNSNTNYTCVCTVLTQTALPVMRDFISNLVSGRDVETLASLCKMMTHAPKLGPKPPSTPALRNSVPCSEAGACSLNTSVCAYSSHQHDDMLL